MIEAPVTYSQSPPGADARRVFPPQNAAASAKRKARAGSFPYRCTGFPTSTNHLSCPPTGRDPEPTTSSLKLPQYLPIILKLKSGACRRLQGALLGLALPPLFLFIWACSCPEFLLPLNIPQRYPPYTGSNSPPASPDKHFVRCRCLLSHSHLGRGRVLKVAPFCSLSRPPLLMTSQACAFFCLYLRTRSANLNL